MDGLLEAEKLGALVESEYASLQKAFLIFTGYNDYLPKDYLFNALERAVMARVWRDRPVSAGSLLKLQVRKFFLGRGAVRAEMESLVNGLKTKPAPAP